MRYKPFFIEMVKSYKAEHKHSPYTKFKTKNGQGEAILYSDHFLIWIMAKFEQSRQKEMDLDIILGKIKVKLKEPLK